MKQVIVSGAMGKVGQRIIALLKEDPELKLLAGIEAPGSEWIAKKMKDEFIREQLAESINAADVIIDFTVVEATLKNLEILRRYPKPIVIGTTGFTPEQRKKIESAAKKIPICLSPNMSVGVNVLFRLVAEAARLLGDAYDIEVIEAHHHLKKDAPSGTAMKIADVLLSALKRKPKDLCYHREGMTGVRPPKEIGMQTIRGGDIVGDHTVMFAGIGERVEITHRATNRDNFARGAILAAKWMIGKGPGLYDMQDVLGLKSR